jgi:hypothetical protein
MPENKNVKPWHPKDRKNPEQGETEAMCHARNPHFAAFGGSVGVQHVYGFLMDGATTAATGTTLQDPTGPKGFWIIEFTVQNPDRLKDYVLRITEDQAGQNELRSEHNIRIDAPTKAFGMNYPATGDTICTSFAPYGTASQAGTVSAALTGDTTGFTQTPKTNPPPNWVLSCTAAAQSGATLTPSQGGSPGTSATNLTIAACHPK